MRENICEDGPSQVSLFFFSNVQTLVSFPESCVFKTSSFQFGLDAGADGLEIWKGLIRPKSVSGQKIAGSSRNHTPYR